MFGAHLRMDSLYTNIDLVFLRQLELDDFTFLGLILVIGVCYALRGIVWDKPDPYHHLWFEKPQAGIIGSKSKETRDIGLKLEQNVSVSI